MNYGYPGANSQLENHRVSEESFWPSFTDIMMVIVMVFLLVTVAVILNNWALIAKLTTSIDAQKAAMLLADNRQEENIGLENKLSAIQDKLLVLNNQYDQKLKALDATQLQLDTAANNLKAKEQSLYSIETKLSTLTKAFEVEQQRLNDTNLQLSESEKKLSDTDMQLLETKNQLNDKNTLIASLQSTLLVNTKNISTLKASIENKAKDIIALQSSLENNEKEKQALVIQGDDLKEKLTTLTDSFKQAEKTILENKEKTDSEKNQLQASLSSALSKIEVQEVSLREAISTSETKVERFEKLLEEAEQEITEKETTIEQLSKAKQEGNERLHSLKGDYETLDTKYQKLLKPARSSKDKFVVTVTYKKSKGKRIIRFKPSPDGSYSTVSNSELNKQLTQLKNKHGKSLYLKVVIPENSGLSYNEAWRFTTTLQHKYDYYFND